MSPSSRPASAIASTPIRAVMSMVVSPSVHRVGLRSATPVTAAHPRVPFVTMRAQEPAGEGDDTARESARIRAAFSSCSKMPARCHSSMSASLEPSHSPSAS
jgi:hypothetical protein